MEVAGQPLAHGETIELAEGLHPVEVRDLEGHGELWLIIGADRVPDEEAVDWSMFPILSRKRYQRYLKDGDLKSPPEDVGAFR